MALINWKTTDTIQRTIQGCYQELIGAGSSREGLAGVSATHLLTETASSSTFFPLMTCEERENHEQRERKTKEGSLLKGRINHSHYCYEQLYPSTVIVTNLIIPIRSHSILFFVYSFISIMYVGVARMKR